MGNNKTHVVIEYDSIAIPVSQKPPHKDGSIRVLNASYIIAYYPYINTH